MLLPRVLPAQQSASKGKVTQGPRALGLLELAPNGKAHLIPIVILYDGQFYDASAYKATPVPMALETGTVYEAIKSGVSQGLFTVRGAIQMKASWIGDGTWQPAGSVPPPKIVDAPPRLDQDTDAPPKLRRPSSEPKPPEPPATPPTAAPSAAPSAVPAPPPASPPPVATAAPSEAPPPEDPDRPALRRGKPTPQPEKPFVEPPPAFGKESSSKPAAAAGPAIQMIPAVSDAGGAEPRPYTYSLKPDEEQQLRAKVLALAAGEVNVRARQTAPATGTAAPSSKAAAARAKTVAKSPQPIFEDVQLRVFDLSNSNQAVMVLDAKAHIPSGSKTTGTEAQYYVTLVAREDLYGEMHKVFSNTADSQHPDLPRMELIDAVDADGDGRAELLFRQSSDAGTAYLVYRVIGNQLWPLFQGTP